MADGPSIIHVLALIAFIIVFFGSIGHAIKSKSVSTFWSDIKDTVLHLDARIKTQLGLMQSPGLFSYAVLFSLLFFYVYFGYLVFTLVSVFAKSVSFVAILLILAAVFTLLPVLLLKEPLDLKHSIPIVNGAFSGVFETVKFFWDDSRPTAFQAQPALPANASTYSYSNSSDVVDLR
jgi:hypothetical protein